MKCSSSQMPGRKLILREYHQVQDYDKSMLKQVLGLNWTLSLCDRWRHVTGVTLDISA